MQTTTQPTEVQVQIEQLGVGDLVRYGEWVGLRAVLFDRGTAQRSVLVRLAIKDTDGDTLIQQREVTTNPTNPRGDGVWLYARLPFAALDRQAVVISVHESIPIEDPELPVEQQARPGRLLGSVLVQPQRAAVVNATSALTGVVSDTNRTYGLNHYAQRPDNNADFSRHLHELTQVVTGLRPAQFPDRWMGWMPYGVLVWGGGSPTEVRDVRAEALRHWVERGGHLVVILPAVGQLWTDTQNNDLASIMPFMVPERREDVEMLPYRPLLTARTDGRFPQTGVVHVLRPLPGATRDQFTAILNNAQGECVVARRLIGVGAVTVIGLDLNHTALAQGDMIDADIFWHRILGKRGETTPAPQAPNPNQGVRIDPMAQGDRSPWAVDSDFAAQIAITGRSAVGALLGFLLFLVYWVVVGPAAFYLLRKRDLHRHSWLGFIAGAGVFTVVAWGAATLLRPQKIEARHLTIVDHVYGQRTARARMWTNVLIPRYGTERISVGDPTGRAAASLSAVAPFDGASEQDIGASGSFLDLRGYAVNTRSPHAMSVPVRATVKSLQVDWADVQTWDMIRPVAADGQSEGVLTVRASSPTDGGALGLPIAQGVIRHNLPGPIRGGRVIVVRGMRRMDGRGGPTSLINNWAIAHELALPDPWIPGEPFDLEVAGLVTPRSDITGWLSGLVPNSASGFAATGIGGAELESLDRRLWALTFLPVLPAPDPGSGRAVVGGGPVVAQRRVTHGLDLGRWFTQPCIIVAGFVGSGGDPAESPVPLFVEGERVPTRGVTMVRWIYPLPANPPEVGSPQEQPGRSRLAPANPLSPMSGG